MIKTFPIFNSPQRYHNAHAIANKDLVWISPQPTPSLRSLSPEPDEGAGRRQGRFRIGASSPFALRGYGGQARHKFPKETQSWVFKTLFFGVDNSIFPCKLELCIPDY